jgi:hypothetical protein
MGINRPRVEVVPWTVPEVAWLEHAGQDAAPIRLDSPEWVAWLDGPGMSFAYPVYDPGHGYIDGFMTVRKERRQRGGSYWLVYRRCGARLRKVYVGPSQAVTSDRLAAIARAFLAEKDVAAGPDTSSVSS